MRIILVTALLAVLAGGTFAQQGWRLEIDIAPWEARGGHNSVVFDDKLWILGGSGQTGGIADVWASSDGIVWNHQYSYSGSPNPFLGHSVMLEFNNEMWVLGGGGGAGSSRVVHSPDGVNWTQEPDAPWLGRSYFGGLVFNGKMWIFGGYSYQPPYHHLFNDVWSTTDGVNWTQEVAAAAWSPRRMFEAVVFNNRMWVIAGTDSQEITNDVWSTADGVNWVQETSNADWEPRIGHIALTYRDRLWVIGGRWGDRLVIKYYDDVWSSADGRNWVEETDGAPWGERTDSEAAVFNDRIWLTGGQVDQVGDMNDVWSYGLHFTPDEVPDPVAGEPYSADFEAHEGDGPFSWSLVSGQLPTGLTLNTSTTSDTLTLEGIPETQQITYTFTIRLEDKDGYAIEQEYTVTVNSPPPPSGGDSGGNSGCTATPAGLPWTLLYGALAFTIIAVLRRRVPS